MPSIGIDLGTTHSAICQYIDGKAELIKNVYNEVLTPSVISIDDEHNVIIGKEAKQRLITHSKTTVANFKRMLGTNKQFDLQGKNYSAVELSALLLKQLIRDASDALGENIEKAVISVPAYFNELQRRATIDAATLAGIKVERLINEPTAAAIEYSVEKYDEAHLLILDLGGGTFDVTVLELFDGIMEVHASCGDNFLGGEDFTLQIAKLICKKCDLTFDKLNQKQHQVLVDKAEAVKRALSNNNEIKETLNLQSKSYEFTITQQEFQSSCEELLQKIGQPIESALRDAKLKPSDFDEIILVGGSSRLSIFQSYLTRMFGRFPKIESDPDYTVARGAALQSALIANEKGLSEVVLTDVMPFSLGVGVVNPNSNQDDDLIFSPIIERNKTIPVSKVESYHPVNNDQTQLNFKIYQGESRYVRNNIKLGDIEINIPKDLKDSTYDVRFTYDNNGILEVIVKSVETGESKEVIIQNQETKLSDAEVSKSFSKLAQLKVHPRENQDNRLTLARCEKLYEISLDEQREYINNIMQHFESILERQDLREIEKTRNQVNEILDQLESY